jgi:hypothetical protein
MRRRPACFTSFERKGSRAACVAAVLAGSALVMSAAPALAQPADEGFDKNPDDTLKSDEQLKKEKGGKMPGEKDKPAAVEADDADKYNPIEVDGKAYRFIGLRFRNFIVPKFMINLFADGGASVNVFSFGPEFTIRKDGVEFDVALSYADYSMDPFLFKGKDDTTEAFEIVSSNMKLVYLQLDIMKDVPLDKKGRFSFLIGGGVGLAAVFGNLYRTQAFPKAGVDPNNPPTEDVTKWQPCPGVQPSPTYQSPNQPYCDDSNDHFGDPFNRTGYDEKSWANGGSKPFVFPYISLPQISFRYKPIKQLQTRLDLGFSITGFYFGLAGGYGL